MTSRKFLFLCLLKSVIATLRFKVACDKDFTIIMKGARVPEGDIVPEKFDNQRCKVEEYNNIR